MIEKIIREPLENHHTKTNHQGAAATAGFTEVVGEFTSVSKSFRRETSSQAFGTFLHREQKLCQSTSGPP